MSTFLYFSAIPSSKYLPSLTCFHFYHQPLYPLFLNMNFKHDNFQRFLITFTHIVLHSLAPANFSKHILGHCPYHWISFQGSPSSSPHRFSHMLFILLECSPSSPCSFFSLVYSFRSWFQQHFLWKSLLWPA